MPPGGRMLIRFSTRSILDDIDREIQRRKFYATLPHKLDNAEDKWHDSQPDNIPDPVKIGELHIRAPWHQSSSG